MQTLDDPNSLIFYEFCYTCGTPFAGDGNAINWDSSRVNDIAGPALDTIPAITIEGITYLKITIGSLVKIWAMDTGASDLYINRDMETELMKQGVLTQEHYLGVEDLELANGTLDKCRKYTVDKIRIGKFYVNNVVVAVSDTGKKILAGKSLLNKFSAVMLDNKNEMLILAR
jgi:hypothetical protein